MQEKLRRLRIHRAGIKVTFYLQKNRVAMSPVNQSSLVVVVNQSEVIPVIEPVNTSNYITQWQNKKWTTRLQQIRFKVRIAQQNYQDTL